MNAKHAVMIMGLLVATAPAGAKPPLQLAGPGVRVEPLAIAPARIENGKFVLGEWQEYQPVQTRGAKGYYYIFDCFGGWVDPGLGRSGYVNLAHGGRGASPSEARTPYDSSSWCAAGSLRWYFGESYVCPLVVEDIQTLAPGAPGGSPIDGVDAAWYWGGGECVLAFFTSDDSALCDDGNPLDHEYHDGVAIDLGVLEPSIEYTYYIVNANGLWSQGGVFAPMSRPGGSYLGALLHLDGSLAVETGTQFMLWGTGDSGGEPFRAGSQSEPAWDDDAPPDRAFQTYECYWDNFLCHFANGKCVGFLGLRCPADVNWDGFVNGADFDLFADWFDRGGWSGADLDGNGFVTADDFDAFVGWFVEGC